MSDDENIGEPDDLMTLDQFQNVFRKKILSVRFLKRPHPHRRKGGLTRVLRKSNPYPFFPLCSSYSYFISYVFCL